MGERIAPLSDTWVHVNGRKVFVRTGPVVEGSTPIVHVHGFGISGTSLVPTAERLAARATTFVPDLPWHGRSDDGEGVLGIGALATSLLEILDALGLERVVLVGNSMGCPVDLEVARLAPERIERSVLVSPAGGMYNQPLRRAMVQLAKDGLREPPRIARTAVPDYLHFGAASTYRLFSEMTRFPSQERLLRTTVPSLAVIGSRDPLMPPPWRVREIARLAPEHITIAVIGGAAHAINFSHPGELAHVIASWLDGKEIVDDPTQPGLTRVLQVGRS